jgi:hypothetical protein
MREQLARDARELLALSAVSSESNSRRRDIAGRAGHGATVAFALIAVVSLLWMPDA